VGVKLLPSPPCTPFLFGFFKTLVAELVERRGGDAKEWLTLSPESCTVSNVEFVALPPNFWFFDTRLSSQPLSQFLISRRYSGESKAPVINAVDAHGRAHDQNGSQTRNDDRYSASAHIHVSFRLTTLIEVSDFRSPA